MKPSGSSFRKTLSILAAAIVLSACLASSAERKNLSFYFSFEGNTSIAGHGAGEMKELMVLTIRKIMEQTGFNIHPMIVPTLTEVLKKTRSEKVDALLVDPFLYFDLKKAGVNLIPLFALNMGFDENTCIYINKNSSVKKLRDLKGKKLAVSTSYIKRFKDFPSRDVNENMAMFSFLSNFLELQYMLKTQNMGLLSESGIEYIIDFPNVDSKLIALDRGLVDAAMVASPNVEINRVGGRDLKNIKPILCSEKTIFITIFATDRMSPTQISRLRNTSINVFENPDEEMKEILKRSNLPLGRVKMVRFSEEDLKYSRDVTEAYEKNNWRPDIEAVVKKLIEDSKKN